MSVVSEQQELAIAVPAEEFENVIRSAQESGLRVVVDGIDADGSIKYWLVERFDVVETAATMTHVAQCSF